MDPSESIAIIENDLRRLAANVFTTDGADDWVTGAFPSQTVTELEKRRTEEAKRRAPARVPQQLEHYTHLYELRSVIEKNWDEFSPALGKKRDFAAMLDAVEDYRNAPAHSRVLLPHEKALLEGYAGLIRTQVTAFLSGLSPDRKHFPLIESARDSSGNELPGYQLAQTFMSAIDTHQAIQVGQKMSFQAAGWDAQGRELTWELGTVRSGVVATATGTNVEMEYTFTTNDVGVAHVYLTLKSPGPHHRHSGYDHQSAFTYFVEPPA